MAESLLKDTDAITKRTIEYTTYRGKFLVRYKDSSGSVHRCHTASRAEADAAFEKWREEMAVTARVARGW
jgi:hypothetical protein